MADPSDFAHAPPDAKAAYDVYSDPNAWPSGAPYPGPTASNIGPNDPYAKTRGTMENIDRVMDAIDRNTQQLQQFRRRR